MNNTLVSVIIPLYNSKDTIKKAIDSVLVQSCQKFEIIVVDDGSEDDGCNVVESIKDNRIRLFRLPHSNANVARNYGIMKSKGKYVAMLDADDYWLKEHLEESLSSMKNSSVDGVCGSPIPEKLYIKGQYVSVRKQKEGENMINYMLSTGFGVQTSTLFMTEQSVKSILWDEKLLRHQDYDFVLRYSKQFKLKIKYNPTVVYRVPDKKNIDFKSCIKFIESIKNEISPDVYATYSRNMLFLAERQKEGKDILDYYRNELFISYSFSCKDYQKYTSMLLAKSNVNFNKTFLIRLLNINRYIMSQDLSNLSIGLKSGKIGICLYFYYLYLLYNEKSYLEYANSIMKDLFAINNTVTSIGFENGLSGIAWCIINLHENGLVSGDLNKILCKVDDILYKAIHFEWLEKEQNHSKKDFLWLLFYCSHRIPKVNNHTEKLLMQETVISIINYIEDNMPDIWNRPFKDFNIEHSELAFYLFVLADIYKLNFYNYKIEKILYRLEYEVLSYMPVLHSERILFAFSISKVTSCIDMPKWSFYEKSLLSSVDFDVMLNKEFLNKNVTLARGLSGFALILMLMNDKSVLHKIKERIISKIETSDIWKEQFNPVLPAFNGNISLFNGYCGVALIYQYLLNQE